MSVTLKTSHNNLAISVFLALFLVNMSYLPVSEKWNPCFYSQFSSFTHLKLPLLFLRPEFVFGQWKCLIRGRGADLPYSCCSVANTTGNMEKRAHTDTHTYTHAHTHTLVNVNVLQSHNFPAFYRKLTSASAGTGLTHTLTQAL